MNEFESSATCEKLMVGAFFAALTARKRLAVESKRLTANRMTSLNDSIVSSREKWDDNDI